MKNSNRKWLIAAQGLLFPWRRCLICGQPCAQTVCAACRQRLTQGRWQPCRHCATFVKRPAVVCAHCLQQRLPAIDGAVALAPYQDPLRRYILSLKYQGKRRLALPLGQAMAGLVQQRLALAPHTLVTPVPAAPQRLAERGYNQAALLAQVVANELALPYDETLLVKTKEAPSQTQLGREGRFANLREVFGPGPGSRRAKGQVLLLVDDVFTTGATACHCAQTLKAAGAAEVYVLTAAAGKSKI